MRLNSLHSPESTDTAERVLSAAERLFAQRGFAATSLRVITTQASVNLAAVNYHFGSKDALIEAVMARRLGPLNRKRLRRLSEVEAENHGEPSVEAILEAFVRPSSRLENDPERSNDVFLQLLAHAYAEPTVRLRAFLLAQHEEVIKRFRAALQRALPHLAPEELHWRMQFLFGAAAYALSRRSAMQLLPTGEDGPGEDSVREDTNTIVQRLITFAASGFRAAAEASASVHLVTEESSS